MDRAVASLPPAIRDLLGEVPVIVLDEPSAEQLESLGIDPVQGADELCGLHTGVMQTERSVEHSGELPSTIHLFRRGIVSEAGGWEAPDADEAVYEQIRVTLLHEIGHEFGLDEADLEDLGYD